MNDSGPLAAHAQPLPADRCPLCGAGNACAMANGGSSANPCWCIGASFGPELLARVPPAARGLACICAACAAAAAEAAADAGPGRGP